MRRQGAGLEQTGAARGPLCAGLPEGTESLEFMNAPAGANFKVSAARGNGVEVSIRQAGAQRMPVRYWPKPSRREWRRQLHQSAKRAAVAGGNAGLTASMPGPPGIYGREGSCKATGREYPGRRPTAFFPDTDFTKCNR